MSILGNFPAAPAKELPEGVVGYLHYNRGEKLPLTKVEVLPDKASLLRTIPGNSKIMSLYTATDYFWLVTENGLWRNLDYNGNVLTSISIGGTITACSPAASGYDIFAYTNGSSHYLKAYSGSDDLDWTCSTHKAKILSCDGYSHSSISVDASGLILRHYYVTFDDGYLHNLKWSTTIPGCTLVYENLCVVVGSVIKLLSEFDGSVLAEVDTGHNIVGLDSTYAYCDDGYVIRYAKTSTAIQDESNNVTGYTGTISITETKDFGKNVNRIVAANTGYFVLYADGEIASVDYNFETVKWSYTANSSGALFSGTYGYVAGPNVVVAREDGNVEILRQELCRVKVYFNEEAV